MFLLMAVLLTACQNSEEEVKTPDDGEDCFLEIAVSAPEHLLFTRGDVGEIASTEGERTVHSLQIWVFKSSDGSKVGYRAILEGELEATLNAPTPKQHTLKMKVDKTFAEVRDNVDIYVVANAASYLGTTVLDEKSKPADLNAAMIDNGSFGTSTLIHTVPSDGLPMSAILKNQTIYGSFPALRIGTQEQPVVLELTRAISKLRFVLCRIKEEESSTKKLVSINSIKLNGSLIPTKTYLMPGTYNYSSYVSDDITFEDNDFENHKLLPGKIPEVVNPLVYAYETQTVQDYENLINHAVNGPLAWLQQYGVDNNIDDLKNLTEGDLPQMKQVGLTYLRESDKQLTGTISYTYNDNGTPKNEDATFLMAQAGDFLRNHSWIVYIYYMDSKIHALTVTHIGMKKWTDGNSDDLKVYNW